MMRAQEPLRLLVRPEVARKQIDDEAASIAPAFGPAGGSVDVPATPTVQRTCGSGTITQTEALPRHCSA
jgi:hypothetical protein